MVSYARANTKNTNKFMYQGITVPHEVGIIGLVIFEFEMTQIFV